MQVNLSAETLELMREAVLYRLVALKQANQPPYEHVTLDEPAIAAHQEAYEMLCEMTEPPEPPSIEIHSEGVRICAAEPGLQHLTLDAITRLVDRTEGN